MTRQPRALAVLLPGFNGTARQPLLLALERALTPLGVRCLRLELPRGAPSAGLLTETNVLAENVDRLAAAGGGKPPSVAAFVRAAKSGAGQRRRSKLPVVLIGRSFGGRVAARYATSNPVDALVLLGFPVRPPGKKRPDDEAALRALRVPTLIVQNTADPLGPLRVLRPLAAKNRRLQLTTVEAKGHGYGRREAEAIAHSVAFVDAYLRRRGV